MSVRFHDQETPPSLMRGERARTIRDVGTPLPVAARRAGVLLLVSGVALNVWALTPPSDHQQQYVGQPDPAHPADSELALALESAADSAAELKHVPALVAQVEDEVQVEPRTPLYAQAVAYPNLMAALSQVPIREKLEAVLALLGAKVEDPTEREAMQAKLRSLLDLPDSVLVQLIELPELAEFSEMLDRTYLGESELWWVEDQLNNIDVIPVTATSDRIMVAGRPTYIYDSAASSRPVGNGERASELRSISAPEPSPQQSKVAAVSQPVSQPVSVDVPAAESTEPAAFSARSMVAVEPTAEIAADEPTNSQVAKSSEGAKPAIGGNRTALHADFDGGRQFVMDATAALRAAFIPKPSESTAVATSGQGDNSAVGSVDAGPAGGGQDDPGQANSPAT